MRKDNVIQVRVSSELKERVSRVLGDKQLSDIIRDALERLCDEAERSVVEVSKQESSVVDDRRQRMMEEFIKKGGKR